MIQEIRIKLEDSSDSESVKKKKLLRELPQND